jgi:hypothetical protein
MDVFSTRFWCVIHFLSISFGVKVLNLIEQDLLAIPSIAELHEVWDFLSINSQHYAFGVAPSMMKTLAGKFF